MAFKKGQSGNLSGKPKGALNKNTKTQNYVSNHTIEKEIQNQPGLVKEYYLNNG